MMQTADQQKPVGSGPARGQGASLADMVQDQPPQPQALRLDTIVKIVILAGLFIWLHWWQFKRLAGPGGYWYQEDWQHGWLIPLFGLFMLFDNRKRLFACRRGGSFWGLAIILLGLAFELAGVNLYVGFVQNLGMVTMLFGLVFFVAGGEVIHVTWLPIMFLMFAMPWPERVHNVIAVTLQNFAATATSSIQPGVKLVGGSAMDVASFFSGKVSRLNVVDACSGIRSLVAYLALGVAYVYLDRRTLWQRIALVVAIVPVAIATNIFRIMITALMYQIDQPQLGSKFMHTLTGLLMLIPFVGIMWLISRLLSWVDRHLFVDEEDHSAPGNVTTSDTGGAA